MNNQCLYVGMPCVVDAICCNDQHVCYARHDVGKEIRLQNGLNDIHFQLPFTADSNFFSFFTFREEFAPKPSREHPELSLKNITLV
jgi:hypothetical protein